VEVPENLSDNGSLGDVGGPAVVGEMDSPVLGVGQTLGNVMAKALYAWKGKKSSHLSFAKGDIITVQEQQVCGITKFINVKWETKLIALTGHIQLQDSSRFVGWVVCMCFIRYKNCRSSSYCMQC
jgi:hypothetical protein